MKRVYIMRDGRWDRVAIQDIGWGSIFLVAEDGEPDALYATMESSRWPMASIFDIPATPLPGLNRDTVAAIYGISRIADIPRERIVEGILHMRSNDRDA